MQNYERLLFRRQFALGPRFLEGFPAWRRLPGPGGLSLTVHPDLPVVNAGRGNCSIALLGYILDPYEPSATDAQIVDRLFTRLEAGAPREEVIRVTESLGGRWILISDDGRRSILFHDACGYRQAFYTTVPSEGLWCGSQPGLLAEALHIPLDPDAQDFLRAYRRRDPQYWWPGDKTAYRDIRHLRPNHYLDLRTGTAHRYWPDRDIPPRRKEDVIAENARLLQGLMESAVRRFDLALTITSGRDTRTILSASRSIRDRLYCFTLMYWDLRPNSADIQIPARLLPQLGLEHHVIVCPSHMNRKFAEIYRRNVTGAHACYGPIAQGQYAGYPAERVCVKGTANTITQAAYRHELMRWRIPAATQHLDEKTLAWIIYRDDPFSFDAIRGWLADANGDHLNVLDLFFWEEEEGNWEAMGLAEWDLVQEAFVPYNCRRYLTNALSLPEPYRAMPVCAYKEDLMRYLWPEVLQEPVNPHLEMSRLATAVDYLGKVRQRVAHERPPTMGGRVQGAYQRHPWLTDLDRLLS